MTLDLGSRDTGDGNRGNGRPTGSIMNGYPMRRYQCLRGAVLWLARILSRLDDQRRAQLAEQVTYELTRWPWARWADDGGSLVVPLCQDRVRQDVT
jgi:hypothetical protein